MDSQTYQAIAMVAYFVMMLGIGFWAYLRTKNFDDYMLAGRDIGPFTTARISWGSCCCLLRTILPALS